MKSLLNPIPLLACLFIAFLQVGCFPLFDCANSLLKSEPNGDGLVAVVFERDCGATTAYSYHVSIMLESEKLGNDDAGEVYITEDPIDSIRWITPRELEVTTSSETSFLKESMIMNVQITYRNVHSEASTNNDHETNKAEHADR
ncbi:MAG: hypothetical protein KGS60_16415 [Verrucomicrobia bacterium]|nr:hypothetical protein [Verrucomicrobiota bacterium]